MSEKDLQRLETLSCFGIPWIRMLIKQDKEFLETLKTRVTAAKSEDMGQRAQHLAKIQTLLDKTVKPEGEEYLAFQRDVHNIANELLFKV